jgi:hypothetical protein
MVNDPQIQAIMSFWWFFVIAFAGGYLIGVRLERRTWERNADVIQRHESGGSLYKVKREHTFRT